MSYILDALKKADAQRESDSFPGMHAAVPRMVFAQVRSRPALPVFWLALAVSVLLLGTLAWRMGPLSAPDVSEPLLAMGADSVSPVVPPEVRPEPIQAQTRPVAPQEPATARPVPESVAKAATPHKTRRVAPMPAQAVAPVPMPPKPVAAESRPYAREDLPPDIQRALPALVISGSTFSENAAYRMLIINGQLVHEGDKPAPDLLLEQIRQKSALLNYKGYRYWQSY